VTRDQNILISDLVTTEKYVGLLQNIIINTLIKQGITFKDFSDKCNIAFEKYNISLNRYAEKRNNIIRTILGNKKIGFKLFELIMTDILNEPIPDDPEITHIKNLGKLGKDLRGQKFDRLVPIECLGVIGSNGAIYWKCQCDCGKESIVSAGHLVEGATSSCGCYRSVDNIIHLTKVNTKHGISGTREYKSWNSMIERCFNKKHKSYPDYGGRGIVVCDEWRNDPTQFVKDMGFRPDGTTLDRKDSNDSYCKVNCRWATYKEQTINRCNTIFINEHETLSAFAKRNNIRYYTAYRLYRKGKLL